MGGPRKGIELDRLRAYMNGPAQVIPADGKQYS